MPTERVVLLLGLSFVSAAWFAGAFAISGTGRDYFEPGLKLLSASRLLD
jgi:hypothetical protein